MVTKKVRIGDFLKRLKEPIKIHTDREYTLVTVKMYHKGVTKRSTVKGHQIKSPTLYSIKANQFILSGIDARNGAFGIVPQELDQAVVSNDFWTHEINSTLININYFYWFSTTHQFAEACIRASEGTTNRQRLQADKFYSYEVELPALKEQELLVDKLSRISRQMTFLDSELAQQKSYLHLLRQTILQEAVQGKLTQREINDKPASELLNRIKADKQQLIKEGKLKKEKELPPIAKDEIPFELPEGWVWCRLGEAVCKITDGFHNTPARAKDGIPYVLATHIKSEGIDFDSCSYVSLKDHKDLWAKASPQKGEILLVNIGAGCGTPAIIDVDFEFSFKNSAIVKQPKEIDSHFLFYYLLSIREKVYNEVIQGGAQPYLSLKMINNLLFPLPPLAEQQRIVLKVQQLQQKLNHLESQIQQGKQHTEMLLQAVLKEAFEGKKERTMNEVVSMAEEE